VVVYTYELSPFSFETKALLDSLEISYKEISLGREWIPGLISEGGSQTRAALLEMTGQSSLPHVFVGGKSIGGLFSGTPGLIPALEQGSLREMVSNASMETAEPVQS
jgi:glutaredoxin